MKINNLLGEFAFQALVKEVNQSGYTLTKQYFFFLEEAQKYAGNRFFKWPAEVYDDGTVYIPSEDELK